MTPQGPLSFIAMIVTDSIEIGRRAVDRGLQGAGTARPAGPPLTLGERNLIRAMVGGCALAGCGYVLIGGAQIGVSVPPAYMAGAAAVSLLYLVIGFRGAQILPFDLMAAVWTAALAIAGLVCFALNVQPAMELPPIARWLLHGLYLMAAVACGLRFVVLVRSARATALPHPSKVPGVATATPASPQAAHAAISRRPGVRPWWKFWS